EALLLVLGAELEHWRRRDPDVRADAGGKPAGTRPWQLLGQHRVVQRVAALAAVLLRVLQAEVAELRHPVEDAVWEPARVLPLLGVRAQLGVDKPADRVPQLPVLVGERWQRAALRGRRQALIGQRLACSHSSTSAALRSGGNTG